MTYADCEEKYKELVYRFRKKAIFLLILKYFLSLD